MRLAARKAKRFSETARAPQRKSEGSARLLMKNLL